MKADTYLKEQALTIAAIENFLSDKGGDWDWDDFTTFRLKTPQFEKVRKAALAVNLPLDEDGRAVLQSLLERARHLQE